MPTEVFLELTELSQTLTARSNSRRMHNQSISTGKLETRWVCSFWSTQKKSSDPKKPARRKYSKARTPQFTFLPQATSSLNLEVFSENRQQTGLYHWWMYRLFGHESSVHFTSMGTVLQILQTICTWDNHVQDTGKPTRAYRLRPIYQLTARTKFDSNATSHLQGFHLVSNWVAIGNTQIMSLGHAVRSKQISRFADCENESHVTKAI